jgi:hypothetical protein
MNEHVREGLVIGYEPLISGLSLPDPEDRHVLAAAIPVQAGVIVTFNLKDFPQESLKPYGVSAQHPDEFVVGLLDLDPVRVCAAVRTQRASLKKPPKSPEEFLELLERQGLVMSAGILREMAALI